MQLGMPFLDWGAEVVERLFEVMNTSGSKHLSYKEFVCGACVLHAGTHLQKLQLVFHMFDASNRGAITRTEFEALAGAVLVGGASGLTTQTTATRAEVEDLRARGAAALVDEGGGSLGGGRWRGDGAERDDDVVRVEISADAVSSLEEVVGALGVLGFDRDRDGRLSFDEWREWAEHSHDVREFVRAMDRVLPED
jgi:Ca2+-binding EF-hand superfamily protein